MKSAQQLQAALNRRREVEQIKLEKSAAVNQYFDKWGKITTRYEQWTGPAYYKTIEDNRHRGEEMKRKSEQLEDRRVKLKELLQSEKEIYDVEIKEANRPKSKFIPTQLLSGISKNFNDLENEKKRADLESKLYKRWRFGMSPDREKIVIESKNENQAIAKLNWLDKQVEQQLQKEKENRESEERQLKLQEEARKHEEFVKDCRVLRESEIKELRSLQENHIRELKAREDETNRLRLEESQLRSRREDIEKEMKKVEINSLNRQTNSLVFYNIRRIKMLFRKRADEIQHYIIEDINILDEITKDLDRNDKLFFIKKKFETQLSQEFDRQQQIESMYESETKHQLIKQENVWNEEIQARELLLRNIIGEQIEMYDKKIRECLNIQKRVLEVKESHLKSIENSNDRIKELTREEDTFGSDNLLRYSQIEDVDPRDSKCVVRATKEEDTDKEKLEPPKYGRKKIAWM